MIASDRVLLDGLIHQWEEEALREYREAADRLRANVVAPANLSYHTAKARQNSLTRCAQQLRAALLVLGDARPHPQEP